MNKEQLIKDITEYCNENDVDISESFSVDKHWDVFLSRYINNLDIILTNVSDHWVILVDNLYEYSAQYQCSYMVWNKYITMVVDNWFENYEIWSIEDIVNIIIEMEDKFQNIIKIICWNTETK